MTDPIAVIREVVLTLGALEKWVVAIIGAVKAHPVAELPTE